MRVFIAILVLILLVATSILLPKVEHNRVDNYQEAAGTALTVSEAAIADASGEVGKVRLYGANFERRTGGGVLSGVVLVEGVGDYRAHAPFQADLDWTCSTTSKPRVQCWRIAVLSVGLGEGETVVVRDGNVVEQLTAFSSAFMSTGESGLETAAMAGDTPSAETMEALPDGATGEAPVSDAERYVDDPSEAATTRSAKGEGTGPSGEESTDLVAANLDPGEFVIETQRRLKILGYNTGAVDGLMGPKTVSAILAYQRRHGLATDGEASAELLDHIQNTIDSRPDQTSEFTE